MSTTQCSAIRYQPRRHSRVGNKSSQILYKPKGTRRDRHKLLSSLVEAKYLEELKKEMSSEQERCELDARARQGETVVPGGTGGKSLEAQEHLAEGVTTCRLF